MERDSLNIQVVVGAIFVIAMIAMVPTILSVLTESVDNQTGTKSPVETASYIIYKDGDYTCAKNGTTGRILSRAENSSAVIQAAIDETTFGAVYVVNHGEANAYDLDVPILTNKAVSIISNGASFNISTLTDYAFQYNFNNYSGPSDYRISPTMVWFEGLKFIGSATNADCGILSIVSDSNVTNFGQNKFAIKDVNGQMCGNGISIGGTSPYFTYVNNFQFLSSVVGGTGISASKCNAVSFDHVWIETDSAGSGIDYGMKIENSSNIHVGAFHVEGKFGKGGVYVYDSYIQMDDGYVIADHNSEFHYCEYVQLSNVRWWTSGLTVSYLNSFQVSNNIFGTTGSSMMIYGRMNYTQISNSEFYPRGGGASIYTDGTTFAGYDMIVTGNIFDPDTTGGAVTIQQTTYSLATVNVTVSNNVFQGTSGTSIMTKNVRSAIITDNIVQSDATGSRLYVRVESGLGLIANNVFYPAMSTGAGNIYTYGTNILIRDNQGYKNQASGVATIGASSTYVTVTHGLFTTPTKIIVTGNNTATSALWVSDIGATTFRINVASAPGVTSTVYWYAEF